MDDWSLLQAYIRENSEDAFAQLVARHSDLVYAACLRRLGDAHQAEDAAQAVFIVLAMKARSIRPGTVLAGWLYNTACFTCRDLRKLAARRERHEQQAGRSREMAQIIQPDAMPAEEQAHLRRHVDEALEALNTTDRDALLLRFLQNKTVREVAAALGVSEAAAEKRVSRAVTKLQAVLGSRGVVASASSLAVSLPACAVPAPATLLGSATQIALSVAKTHAALTPTHALAQHVVSAMQWARVKAAAVALVTVATVTAVTVLAAHTAAQPPVVKEPAAPPLQGPEDAPAPKTALARQIDTGGAVFSLAILPDGRTLLSGGSTTLHAWDISTGKEIRSFRTELELFAAVVVSVDGKRAVSLDGQGRVQVWDVEKGEPLRQLDDAKAGAVARHALAFSADGKRVASSDAAAIDVWDATTGGLLHHLEGHTQPVAGIAFAPDGKRLVSGGADKAVRVWDLETGKPLRVFNGTTAEVLCVACSSDGKTAASGAADGSLLLWDLERGTPAGTLTGHTAEVNAVAFLPDGRLLSAGGGANRATLEKRTGMQFAGLTDCNVRLWDVRTCSELQCYTGHAHPISALAVLPNGQQALSAAEDVRLWNLPPITKVSSQETQP